MLKTIIPQEQVLLQWARGKSRVYSFWKAENMDLLAWIKRGKRFLFLMRNSSFPTNQWIKMNSSLHFLDRMKLRLDRWGFPSGAVVENLPADAGDTGSSPGLGRSRMPWSSWAREPQLLSLHIWSLCSATREAAIVRGPRLPQIEKALTQKRRPNTAKNKINK